MTKTGYKFSNISLNRLRGCHPDLIKIMNLAISVTDVDFGIAEGQRSIEMQQKYFHEGKSKIDGINQKSKHNYNPSLAVDIYAYFDGKAQWDKEIISYLAGIIRACAEVLKRTEEITHSIRWGGNWDMDGVILLDQSFDDRPHFELVKY